MIRSLGDRVKSHPDAYDWFCYRILGHEGERLPPWRYEAYPNLSPMGPDQSDDIYPDKIFDSWIELSISARFPMEDIQLVADLISKYLRKGIDEFDEMSDEQWDYVRRYIPNQPYKRTFKTEDRRIVDGIRYVLKTGCPLTEIPRKYGSYMSVRLRLKKWSEQGVLEPILSSIDSDETYKDRLSNYLRNSDHELASKRHDAPNVSIKGEMAPMSVFQ